jgi:hypothetical protein
MADENPYRTPEHLSRSEREPKRLRRSFLFLTFVVLAGVTGTIAGAVAGYAVGDAVDEFNLTYFGVSPRKVVVLETVIGAGAGLVVGLLLGLILFAVIRWIIARLRRSALPTVR